MRTLALLFLACQPAPGPSRKAAPEPVDTADPHPPRQAGGGTRSEGPDVVLEPGTPVVCADPSVRETARFRRDQGGVMPVQGANLTSAGLIMGDFDRDGLQDVLIPGEAELQLWRGTGADPATATLVRVQEAWLDDLQLDDAVGGVTGDVNGDGWLDAVITRFEAPNAVLINDGTGGFTDQTPPAFLAHAHRTQSATLADLDGDGDLDLFFGSYGPRPDDWDDPDMPPGDPSELYENTGSDWVDRSDRLPQAAHDAYTFMAPAIDLDGDTLPELYLSNDFGLVRPSLLLWNRGGFDFTADDTFHPDQEDMGVGIGDVNHDGQPDFLVTSSRVINVLASGDALGLPQTWIASAVAWNLQVDVTAGGQYFGWGADWGDVDNDGDLDAIALFGWWEEWNTLGGPVQRDGLWEQTSPLGFEQVAFEAEWEFDDEGYGRGLIVADWNGDGWLDVFKRRPGQMALLYTAHCGSEHWLGVELSDAGPNTHGVGARIAVVTDGQTHTRWILAGGNGMYSGTPPLAHIGLGGAERVDRVEVTWPDGEIHVFEDVDVDQRVRIVRY